MATRPTVCPPTVEDGFIFDRMNLVLVEGNNISDIMDLSKFYLEIDAYAKMRYQLSAGSSVLITQDDLGDAEGYVNFIVVKVVYPSSTDQSSKYLYWTYASSQYNLGELMVLTGERTDTDGQPTIGWNLSSTTGGITITNPHTDIDVEIELLVAR